MRMRFISLRSVNHGTLSAKIGVEGWFLRAKCARRTSSLQENRPRESEGLRPLEPN